MPVQIVVGSQWGDEGKGKIVDILSEKSDLVVRSQGGNNAGHTVKLNKTTYRLNLVPSGILYKHCTCLIGCGTVVNPAALVNEIETLKKQNVSFDKLAIDPRANVIMPWHIELDSCLENARSNSNCKIGTTKNGIGPCYADKAYRLGIKLSDLVNEKILVEKINLVGKLKNNILMNIFKKEPINLNAVQQTFFNLGKLLEPYFSNGIEILEKSLTSNKNILFEGAQGTLLDINFGTYPFVTSSSTVAGGTCTGSPIGPTKIDNTIGVAKAYLTRVGEGPFPTEIKGEVGQKIRKIGHEYGTNTKRPRRVGWLDCVMLKHAIQINGMNQIALNKLDVLRGIDPIKICYAYKIDNSSNKILSYVPENLEMLTKIQPVYKELPGFFESIEDCKNFNQLPQSCKNYVETIEHICNCKITMIGVGPDRNQNIEKI